MRWPIQLELDIEGTPVAIAAMSVAGIVGVCYSNVEPQARMMAIQAMGQLAGAAGGVAIPQMVAKARRRTVDPVWADKPGRMPVEWSENNDP